MAYKLGYQEAVTATAHKLARIIYALLENKREFDPAILDVKHQYNKMKKIQSLKKMANAEGYKLVLIEQTG